ncbi:FadR/GntR family transcriptional regulator [Diaminobutyricibacter sp. McL0618]|uniref:FadR/GntR family transcriptional regulator n=1 Tax=Leifsonia sp. McL0618 TaxID=3415677 RepID=UPI003CF1F99F
MLSDPAIAGITRLSATETVRARIALAIQLGLLAPNEQLPSDAEVAGALDVSEITVRRALKSLADDGVLTRLRGRRGGTFVAEKSAATSVDAVTVYRSDAETVHALINQRVLLECALTHHAALAITEQQLASLDQFVAQASSALNWTDYHAADEKLHLAVAQASGLAWALPNYHEVLFELYRYFVPYPIAYLHNVNEQHRLLVDALRRRDPVEAVAIIEYHVAELHRSMFVGLSQNPDGE